jgi:hypothetical protein
MRKIFAIALFGIGASVAAMAALPSPEIDPSSAGSALTLLAGAAFLIIGKRRK